MVKDIAFSSYPAKDVPALKKFYEDALGLTFSGNYEEEGTLKYAESQVGNSWFAVMTREWHDVAPSGGIAFEVDDVDATLEKVRAAGAKADDTVHDTPVCRITSFNDPEGNKVTLHQTTVPH